MTHIIGRTTVFKALKLPNGKVVCIDTEHLATTTKVVTEKDYDLAKSLGWSDSPQEAMDRFEAEECRVSEDAAVRAYDDRHLSESAKTEAESVESSTVRHLVEIPEAPKKRGRPKKLVQ